jgi:hypothetical protein
MPLVLAVNYGEYDPTMYLELLGRAYDAVAEGLGPPREILKPPLSSGNNPTSNSNLLIPCGSN